MDLGKLRRSHASNNVSWPTKSVDMDDGSRGIGGHENGSVGVSGVWGSNVQPRRVLCLCKQPSARANAGVGHVLRVFVDVRICLPREAVRVVEAVST